MSQTTATSRHVDQGPPRRLGAQGAEPAPPSEAERRLGLAVAALARGQDESGCWKGDYGGALFLTPIFVIAAELTGYRPVDAVTDGIRAELARSQNQDGGFGLHSEGPSTVFTTSLAYVALRLLGAEPGGGPARRALRWLRSAGGPLGIPSWGKLVLAVAGLYSYEGMNPVLPELWLLPRSLPVHPGRLWCHCRAVYLPMSFLYGLRAEAPSTPLREALREELYDGGFASVDWPAARDRVSPTDLASPRSPVLGLANRLQRGYEARAPAGVRSRALDEVLDHIRHEDETTGFIDIGPVNQLLNLLVEHFVEPGSERVRRHHERLAGYLRLDEDGARVQGYNSTELWDTAFAVQALAAHRAGLDRTETLAAALRFVRDNQVLEDVPEAARHHRHPSKGGWPFSDRPHGWPISDCTGEALAASLLAEGACPQARVPDERLADAVRFILSVQNPDGGFPTYEPQRGTRLLELLNPSEVFGAIMVDYSYPECTGSCLKALVAFQRRYPGLLAREIRSSVRRGLDYLLRVQRPDGSWYGSWGICFTYGTWFAVSGLREAGLPSSHPAIGRARRFLLSKQREDGGWGEHFTSCTSGEYVQAETSRVVQTAWAVMTLLRAGDLDREAIDRGVCFLHRRQLGDGRWAREAMAGVFNRTCMLNYDNYYQVFPTWALGLHASSRGL